MHDLGNKPPYPGLKRQMYEVIFEADTPAGRAFDVALLVTILLSVFTVMLESVAGMRKSYGEILFALEWLFTVLFATEYVLRIYCSHLPRRYIFSFFGVIDLLAVVPTFLSLLFTGTQYLLVIRVLRLLRVFRIFKMTHFLGEADVLSRAIRASLPKIMVFLGTVLTLVVIIGALMHLIEGPKSGFTSIPRSMYWAIVTLTTVGYGDITPQTIPGQTLAAAVMVLGYGIIAVPTGIVSVEMARASSNPGAWQRKCEACGLGGHELDARYCRGCGERMG